MPLEISFQTGDRSNLGFGFFTRTLDLTTLVLEEVPTGLINSSNMDYTTAATFQKLWVWLNGLRMRIGVDYNLTGADSFSFLYPPTTGDSLLVDYLPA